MQYRTGIIEPSGYYQRHSDYLNLDTPPLCPDTSAMGHHQQSPASSSSQNGQQTAVRAKKRRGGGEGALVCVVCGDQAFGKHYGVNACNGCKGFFRRSVWNNRTYACRIDNNCHIAAEQRNVCRACRLKRCYSTGMNPRAVQTERDQGNKVKVEEPDEDDGADRAESASPQVEMCSIQVQTDDHKQDCHMMPSPMDDDCCVNACSGEEIPQATLISVARRIRTMDARIRSVAEAPLEAAYEGSGAATGGGGSSTHTVPFADAFFNPATISLRTPMAATGVRVATLPDVIQDWRRCFTFFADWCHALPEFNRLPTDDQLVLGKNRFGPFYWWLAADWATKAGCDGVCYANGTYFPATKEQQCCADVRNVSRRMMNELVGPLLELKIDDTERALMQAVIVFQEELPGMTETGCALVREARALIIRVLTTYINAKGFSHTSAAIRVARLNLLMATTTNLVYLTNDNVQLNDVLHLADFGEWFKDIKKESYTNF